jgi:WD40 repeat protein
VRGEGKKEEVKPAQEENTVQRDDPLPAGSTLRFGTSRFRHGIPVSTMAVSADSRLAVAVNGNYSPGATRVFDLVSGRALYTLGGREGTSIEAAAISPDGRTIVTKQDFSLRIRDAATGKELRKIELQRANQYSSNEWAAFTPDGKALAVTSQGSVIHLIDFESGRTIRDFSNDNPEHRGWESVLGITFSADGKLMATGGFTTDHGTYFARLWEVETGKELRRFRHSKQSYGIPSLAFSPDAKTLATRSHDGRLRLFDVDTGKERHTFPADGGGRKLGTVAFSPDGRTVAAAGDSIRLYDVTTGAERLRIDRRQASHLYFTDGGKTLTAAVDGAICRWDTTTGQALTPEAGDSAVEQVLVSADGGRVVTRGQCADAHIWDGTTGEHLRRFQAGWQCGMAISPDGRFLAWPVDDAGVTFADPQEPASLFYGSRIRFYDISAAKTGDRIPTFKGAVQDLAFTNDGKRLVTAESHGAFGTSRPASKSGVSKRCRKPSRTSRTPFGGRWFPRTARRWRRPTKRTLVRWGEQANVLSSFNFGTLSPGKNCPSSAAATSWTGRFRPTADSSSPGRFRLPADSSSAGAGLVSARSPPEIGWRLCPTSWTFEPPPFRATAAFWQPLFPEVSFKSGKWRPGPSGTNSRTTATSRPF